MIAAPSQHINTFSTKQIEPTRNTQRLSQNNLSSFSGDFFPWLSFIDQFRSTVHDIDKLSPVEKLKYLESCLTSHASKLIMNLETKESNYELVIQMLEQRYKNHRVILRRLLSRIHGFTPSQTEKVSQPRQLHSVFNETSQSIKALEGSEEINMWLSSLREPRS